jgi:MFS family permease
MSNVLHVPLLLVGLIFAFNAVLGGFVQIYSGYLGDQYGYKKTIILFSAGNFITLILLFLSAKLFPIEAIFIILFIVNQTMSSLFQPSLSALLSLSSDIPLSGFSYMRVGSNLGWAFGPALGGVIISAFGYPYIFAIAAVATFLSIPLYLFLKEGKFKSREKTRFSFRNAERAVYLFGAGTIFLFVVVSQFSVTLSIYANHIVGLGTASIGLIYFVNGIVVAAFQLPVYLLIKKIGLWNGMILGTLLYMIGYFSMALDHNLVQFLLSMFIVTMGENAVTPTGNAIVSKISGGKKLGTHMGIYNFFNSFGRGMGPAYGTILLSYLIDPFEIWGLAIVPAGVALMVFATLKFRNKEDDKLSWH